MKFSCLFLSLFLISCANIGTLGGGEADTVPPKLIKHSIPKTQFKGKSIELEFDEYISLNQPEKNIKLFPSHSGMKFSIGKKKLHIQFDTLLRENTTYNLQINQGIVDINANNLYNYSCIFSTGNTIDSAYIKVVIDGFKELKSMKICITEKPVKDSFKSFRSDYIQTADKELIEFSGLKNIPYTLYFFTDENGDNKPDPYRPSNILYNCKTDSTYKLQALEWMKPFKIEKSIYSKACTKIFYTKLYNFPETLEKYSGLHKSQFLFYTEDSALLLSSGTSIKSERNDTVDHIDADKEIKQYVFSRLKIIKTKNQSILYAVLPQYYAVDDSMQNCILYKHTIMNGDSLLLLKNRKGDTDSFDLKKIPVSDPLKLSFFQFSIQDSIHTKFDVKLIKDTKEIRFISGINKYEEYLEPGVYKLEIWPYNSLYSYNPYEMQEKVKILYEKTVLLKASWEEILDIKL